jgi:hypothetical protein
MRNGVTKKEVNSAKTPLQWILRLSKFYWNPAGCEYDQNILMIAIERTP